jgi:hypothetical protein
MKTYITPDYKKGFPVSENLYYECIKCGEIIKSVPEDNVCCTCRNICIDIDAGRVSVKDESNIKIFST